MEVGFIIAIVVIVFVVLPVYACCKVAGEADDSALATLSSYLEEREGVKENGEILCNNEQGTAGSKMQS